MYYNIIELERQVIKMDSLNMIFFVILIVIGVISYIYGTHRKKDFDERQAAIRNHGYRYTLITIGICDVLLFFVVEYLNLKITPSFLLFAPFVLGVIVFDGYTIFRGAYLTVHEKILKSEAIAFTVIGLWELIDGIRGLVINTAAWESYVLFSLLGIFLLLDGGSRIYQLHMSKAKK